MKILLLALLASFVAVPVSYAQECDCSKAVGMCTASVKVANITGTKEGRAYAAAVELKSSQPRCSKISFFVDNTPYLSVLNNSNAATENVFGTSEISAKSVSIDYCRICAVTGSAARGAEPAQGGNAMTQRFNAALQDSFDKEAERKVAATRVSSSLAGSQEDAMTDVLNALGTMQGISQQTNARSNARGGGIDPVVRNLNRQMSTLPAQCRSNPQAAGCPYATNPNGYDPRR